MEMVNTGWNNGIKKGELRLSLFLYRRVFIVTIFIVPIYSHYVRRLNNHAVTLPLQLFIENALPFLLNLSSPATTFLHYRYAAAGAQFAHLTTAINQLCDFLRTTQYRQAWFLNWPIFHQF